MKQRLLTPGPTPVPEETLLELAKPVFNGADTLDGQLNALAQQEYSGCWELVVADNGSDWYISGAPDPRWNDEALERGEEKQGNAELQQTAALA